MFFLSFTSEALIGVESLSRAVGWDRLVYTLSFPSGRLRAVSLFTLHKDLEYSAFIKRRAIRSGHFSNVCKCHFVAL
jgi:hypothetical protein